MDGAPSAAILAANRRLYELRARRGIGATAAAADTPVSPPPATPPADQPPLDSSCISYSLTSKPVSTLYDRVNSLPAHLGWGSETLTDHLRRAAARQQPAAPPPPTQLPPAAAVQQPEAAPATTVVVHPSLALAILRHKQEAPGRLYFLLRALDQAGQGWLAAADLFEALATRDAPWRIGGRRRLRQLLAAGEGLFWQRDDRGRVWLRAAHRVAHDLDLTRLQGSPVDLPVAALLGGIMDVRAAFYATWHAGRQPDGRAGGGAYSPGWDGRPISRATLTELTGIPARTQREYDRRANIDRTRNFAVGEAFAPEHIQERAWRHGRAIFKFTDLRGQQGPAGQSYVAWNLPNSYRTPYQRRSGNGRKRLNRRLADLLKKGTTGNDEQPVEKLFFHNGALAVKRYNRRPENDAFWPQAAGGSGGRAGSLLWRVIGGTSPLSPSR